MSQVIYPEILECQIETASHVDQLQAQVNVLIEDGWQPHGGISSAFNPNGFMAYSLLMVYYKED